MAVLVFGLYFRFIRLCRRLRHFRIRACAVRRYFVYNASCQNIRFGYHIRRVHNLAGLARPKFLNLPASAGQRVLYQNIGQRQVAVVFRRDFICYRFAKHISFPVCRNACRTFCKRQMAVLVFGLYFCFTRRYRYFRSVRIGADAACRSAVYNLARQKIRFGYRVRGFKRFACSRHKAFYSPVFTGQIIRYHNVMQRQVAVVCGRDFIGNRFAKDISVAVCRSAYGSLFYRQMAACRFCHNFLRSVCVQRIAVRIGSFHACYVYNPAADQIRFRYGMGRCKNPFRIRRKTCRRPAFACQIIVYSNIA